MISRVLRHCGGVDSKMRERLLKELNGSPVSVPDSCRVYAVFPDCPAYFWHPIRRAFSEAMDSYKIPFKSNVCTKVSDEETILNYLDEADEAGVSAVVLAVSVTEKIRERISDIRQNRLILFLSGYSDIANTFYCGSNVFLDGYEMGQYYRDHYPDRQLVLISLPDDVNTSARLDGFMKALHDEPQGLSHEPETLNVPRKMLSNFKLLPSKLAPLLKKAAGEADRIAVYVPAGLHNMPLAVQKAGLQDRTVLLIHDPNPEQVCPFEMASMRQDLSLQGKTAAELTAAFLQTGFFPDDKHTFIPSTADHIPGPNSSLELL